jgi:hypothetical protein
VCKRAVTVAFVVCSDSGAIVDRLASGSGSPQRVTVVSMACDRRNEDDDDQRPARNHVDDDDERDMVLTWQQRCILLILSVPELLLSE